MEDLGSYGHINDETGKFVFDLCDSCGGPKLGHNLTEHSSCEVKPKMTKSSREFIEDILQKEPEFGVAHLMFTWKV